MTFVTYFYLDKIQKSSINWKTNLNFESQYVLQILF